MGSFRIKIELMNWCSCDNQIAQWKTKLLFHFFDNKLGKYFFILRQIFLRLWVDFETTQKNKPEINWNCWWIEKSLVHLYTCKKSLHVSPLFLNSNYFKYTQKASFCYNISNFLQRNLMKEMKIFPWYRISRNFLLLFTFQYYFSINLNLIHSLNFVNENLIHFMKREESVYHFIFWRVLKVEDWSTKYNVSHIVNSENTYIFDLIDNVGYVTYALYPRRSLALNITKKGWW